jgi:thioesterase domain-containing protein
MIEVHWAAIESYQAKAFDGPTVLFQARAQPLFNTMHPDRSWQVLDPPNLTRITVPGSHEGMFHDPHVERLSHALRRVLYAAQASASRHPST